MRAFWITAAVTLVLDQLSKYAVVQGLDLARRGAIDVLPPFVNFRMAWNQGVNFGLLSSDNGLTRWILIGVALLISGLVTWWMHKDRSRLGVLVSGGLLVGGAIGNIIDRLVYGAVADFLNMSCCGFVNPWSFNVADVAIFAGAAGLFLFDGGKSARDSGQQTP